MAVDVAADVVEHLQVRDVLEGLAVRPTAGADADLFSLRRQIAGIHAFRLRHERSVDLVAVRVDDLHGFGTGDDVGHTEQFRNGAHGSVAGVDPASGFDLCVAEVDRGSVIIAVQRFRQIADRLCADLVLHAAAPQFAVEIVVDVRRDGFGRELRRIRARHRHPYHQFDVAVQAFVLFFRVQVFEVIHHVQEDPLAVLRFRGLRRLVHGGDDVLQAGLPLLRNEYAGDRIAFGIQKRQRLALADRAAELRLQLRVAGIDDRRAHLFVDRVQRFLLGRNVIPHGVAVGVVQAVEFFERVQRRVFHAAGILQRFFRRDAELFMKVQKLFFVRLRHEGDPVVMVRRIHRRHLRVDAVQFLQELRVFRRLLRRLRKFFVKVLECFKFVGICHGDDSLFKHGSVVYRSYVPIIPKANPTNVQQGKGDDANFCRK